MKGLSKEQIICLDIRPALDGFEEEFDIDAIFDEAYTYRPELDGFQLAVSGEQFWDIVEKHCHTKE